MTVSETVTYPCYVKYNQEHNMMVTFLLRLTSVHLSDLNEVFALKGVSPLLVFPLKKNKPLSPVAGPTGGQYIEFCQASYVIHTPW